MGRFVSFLSGFILGGLIGVGVALVLTPASGEEFRGQIQARAKQIQLEVQQAAAEKRAELEQQIAAYRTPRKPTSEA